MVDSRNWSLGIHSISNNFFRYTEIWSAKDQSKIIQLSEPKLEFYLFYPELMLVDINYCVKPWNKNILNTVKCKKQASLQQPITSLSVTFQNYVEWLSSSNVEWLFSSEKFDFIRIKIDQYEYITSRDSLLYLSWPALKLQTTRDKTAHFIYITNQTCYRQIA